MTTRFLEVGYTHVVDDPVFERLVRQTVGLFEGQLNGVMHQVGSKAFLFKFEGLTQERSTELQINLLNVASAYGRNITHIIESSR